LALSSEAMAHPVEGGRTDRVAGQTCKVKTAE